VLEGEAIMFRTIWRRASAWELILPPELLRLPQEPTRVGELLDDPGSHSPGISSHKGNASGRWWPVGLSNAFQHRPELVSQR